MKSNRAPRHIAIIMDGNGRWALQRGLVRIQGHRQGARVVRKIAQACAKRGVEYLTLYAFSSENWARPEREVSLLMKLLKIYAMRERVHLQKDNIRLRVIGALEKLPEGVRRELEETIRMTSSNTGLCLQLALSYSGREEILRAINKWKQAVDQGRVESSVLTEESFRSYLDTGDQPDPDLIIRTSGEQRISNFLIWQCAYSEFYFTDCLWPDFNEDELDRAIEAFHNRDRRYGRLKPFRAWGGEL